MEFWDSFAKKLTDAADYTIKEAEKFTGAAKLKFDITVVQKHIEDVYTNIGVMSYDTHKNGTDNEERIVEAVAEIDSLTEKLEAMKLEHASLKNYKICTGCGAKIDRDTLYCPKCGLKQDEI